MMYHGTEMSALSFGGHDITAQVEAYNTRRRVILYLFDNYIFVTGTIQGLRPPPHHGSSIPLQASVSKLPVFYVTN